MVPTDSAKEILRAFATKPSKPKYIREIANECNISYERVQHYLKELEKIKVVRSAQRGKIKEYTLNKEHGLIQKIFSLIEMEKRQKFYEENSKLFVWLHKMIQQLISEEEMKTQVGKSKSDIKFIVLFGSVARKEAKTSSDIDLLIVVKNKDTKFINYTELIRKKMNTLSGKEFSLHIIEMDEMKKRWKTEPVYASLWLDHIVLFGDEAFWRIVLELGEPV